MKDNHPPAGPTEQEVREHFGNKLKPDAELMRPAYTSIWALEDGTLLWDWRNGFADGKPVIPQPKLKTIMYVTGEQGSGKTQLVKLMSNAVEVNARSILSQYSENLLRRVETNAQSDTIVFTAQRHSPNTEKSLRLIAEEHKLIFYTINLTPTNLWKHKI